MTSDTFRKVHARLVDRLTQAGVGRACAHAELDALLLAAHQKCSGGSTMEPQDVPHELVMAGMRAAGAMSGDSVRAVLAAVLPLLSAPGTSKASNDSR
ncbi:hypothetical protein [Embleya scabrispora]|uniref:hypothetical protein n=1 Tax=Embleya scabrispora TaxID=159449 RepID=UPI00117F6DE4|nr:hypothetical protein [Embleya scabrispora]